MTTVGTLVTPCRVSTHQADTLPIVPLLRDDYLEKPDPRRLTAANPRYAEIISRHSRAVSAGEPCYVDPATGLSVFTAAFHAERGSCCDSGCRHCPFVIA
jgi:hypothetical protein